MLLTDIAAMLRDPEWRLPVSVRTRARLALSLFADPCQPVSDEAPGLEFLDEAAAVEIIGREFRNELAGYREYRRYREVVSQRFAGPEERPILEELLLARRRRLRARIQARRQRVEARVRLFGGPPDPPLLAFR